MKHPRKIFIPKWLAICVNAQIILGLQNKTSKVTSDCVTISAYAHTQPQYVSIDFTPSCTNTGSPLSWMAQSSNDQTDTEALRLWEWLPFCPRISSGASLTHIMRSDSQRRCCPLMDSQETVVYYLIHARISSISSHIKGPNISKDNGEVSMPNGIMKNK